MQINRPEVFPEEYARCEDNERRLKFLLRYAILAPSTINTQPWLFKIDAHALRIDVHSNTQRKLVVSDPLGREMCLSLGACVANILLAAEAYGLVVTHVYFPEGKLVAQITFTGLEQKQYNGPLLESIIKRHTNRANFDKDKPISQEYVHAAQSASDEAVTVIFLGRSSTKQLRSILGQAALSIFSKALFRKEAASWFRPSKKNVTDGFPGYYLGIPKLVSYIMPYLVRYVNIGAQQQKLHEQMIEHASGYVVLSTKNDDRMAWLEAGERFERLAVSATKHGIKVGILTAVIEVVSARESLGKLVGHNFPQMFFRLGYTDSEPIMSPRIPVDQLIIS